MKILSIETSCDETAVSVVEAVGIFPDATYKVLGNALLSQIDIHKEYGGVFPAMAKREHIKAILPMMEQAMQEASLLEKSTETLPQDIQENLYTLLHREDGLAEALIAFAENHKRPEIDAIAVTNGPGLEPALWVGVNFAKALSYLLNIPVIPVNHMEGHVLSSVFNGYNLPEITFPALSLLISGGHTELVLMKDWQSYELIGQTRDDAVGEAFDKVARMLDLPYPGGPKIAELATKARDAKLPPFTKLPKPMLDSGDHDFSFSGLKTAVKYAIKDTELTDTDKQAIARDFEDAATEVLLAKTVKALEATNAQTLILGGGVTASTHIRNTFTEYFSTEYPDVAVYFPDRALSTDNSIMIALAGHARLDEAHDSAIAQSMIAADGNRALARED